MGMVYRYFKGHFTLPFLYNHALRNRGRWRLGNISGSLGPAGTGGPTRGHATATPCRLLLCIQGLVTKGRTLPANPA